MKVAVTKDYWNGYRSITKEVDIEAVNGKAIALALMEKGVACITITRALSINKIVDEMNTEPEDKS